MRAFHLILALAMLMAAPVTLSACHTVEGAGQDIEELGDTVEQGGQSGYND